MNESNTSNRKPLLIGGVVVSAVLIIGVYTLFLKKSDSPSVASSTNSASQTVVKSAETAQTQQSPETTSPATTDTAPASTTYKDGTYTKTIDYRVPEGGTNQLTTSVVVKGDVITSVTSSSQYDARESKRYVDGFNGNISGTVSGKKLSDIHIGRVGGASLTSAAFNSIIEAVMTDAKA